MGHLHYQLVMAEDQATAAIAIARYVDDLLGDGESVRLVATDIAECWGDLDEEVRQEYDRRSAKGTPDSGLALFVEDYRIAVDSAWRDDEAVDVLSDEQVVRMCRLSWQERAAQIGQRLILREPPADDWLARFPLKPLARLQAGVRK